MTSDTDTLILTSVNLSSIPTSKVWSCRESSPKRIQASLSQRSIPQRERESSSCSFYPSPWVSIVFFSFFFPFFFFQSSVNRSTPLPSSWQSTPHNRQQRLSKQIINRFPIENAGQKPHSDRSISSIDSLYYHFFLNWSC